ncbi:hypothetical protein Tco_0191360 [Tanacetum coccineum]
MAPLPGRVVSAAEILLMINLVDIVLASGVDIIIEGFDQFQPSQFPVIHQPPQETNTEILQARENLMEAIQAFLKKYDHIPPREKCMALLLAGKKSKINQKDQAAKICIPYWKCPIFDNDDDEEYTIQVREYYDNSPVAITPVLPTLEPEDSLIMGNEELSTIPEKESYEFIKSSVEDLVPIPSESEDTSGSDSECIIPSCDDFSPINVYEETSVTFSNPLFNSNDDFTSSDDESLSDEDVPEDNVKIYSNPLFEFNDEYISTLLVTSLSDANEDECFDPGGDIDEIDAFLNDYYDSKGDIIYLESLLIKNTTPNLPLEVFAILSLNHFVEIPSGESKVHIEVLSVLWGNRLPIPDGSLPLSRYGYITKGQKQSKTDKTEHGLRAPMIAWELIKNQGSGLMIEGRSKGLEGSFPPYK